MDFAIRDAGYFFIETKNGADIALSRRGDFAITGDRFLTDGAGNYMLDNNMKKINVQQNRDLIIDESGVDITEELVNLITSQRNFQASSKAIETSTQLTQAIINIRS